MAIARNIGANLAGGIWVALIGVAFVPIYIRVLGPEAYGVIGVFASLTALLALLDLGLSQVMNREMARLSAAEATQRRLAIATASTLEALYWLLALLVGIIAALAASPIASYWLNPGELTREGLERALMVIALVIALRWPVSVYVGGLNGLQLQARVNLVAAAAATIQALGAVAAIIYVSPTLECFFVWQAISALAHVLVIRKVFWAALGNPDVRPGVSREVLRSVWRFALGTTAIAVLAAALTQADKLILSKILSLEDFGYYTFAVTIASIILRLAAPIFTAYYPRFTALLSGTDQGQLKSAYFSATQMICTMVVPVAYALIFLPAEILRLWTGNAGLEIHAAPVIAVLVLGNVINAIMNIPYALQLAAGWTTLSVRLNAAAVLLLIPAIYLAASRWGAIGSAWAWVGLNLAYITIGIGLMHRRLLRRDRRAWYAGAVILPCLSALVFALPAYLVLRWLDASGLLQAILICFTVGLSMLGAVVGSDRLRGHVLAAVHRLRKQAC